MSNPKMQNAYPGAISTYPTWTAHETPYTAEWGDSVGYEFYSIEYELGANVRKGFINLATRLDDFNSRIIAVEGDYVDKSGGDFEGNIGFSYNDIENAYLSNCFLKDDLNAMGNTIKNLGSPSSDLESATKKYVDDKIVPTLFAPCVTLDENGTLNPVGAYGAKVDTANDIAYARIIIPDVYVSFTKIRIHGRSHVEDAQGMRLYSLGGGESIDLPRWNDCAWTVTKTSAFLNLTVDCHVYWEITTGDDGGIGNIVGGRSIDFWMQYAAADGDVAASNVDIIGVEIFIGM